MEKRRRALGLDRATLGARVGMTAEEIRRVEAGRDPLAPGRAMQLAAALELPADALIDDGANPGRSACLADAMHDWATSAEAAELVRLYALIADPVVRAGVLALVIAVSEGESAELADWKAAGEH